MHRLGLSGFFTSRLHLQGGTTIARSRRDSSESDVMMNAAGPLLQTFNVVCSISMLHIFRFLQILDFRRKIHENCFSGHDRAHNGSVQIPASLIRQKTPYPSSRPHPHSSMLKHLPCRPPPFPPLQFNVVERCGGKSRGVAFLPRESPRGSDGEPAQSAVRRRNFFSTLNCKGGKGGEKRANREQKFQRWIRLRRLVHQNTICCFQH